jgi:hypothetical protein
MGAMPLSAWTWRPSGQRVSTSPRSLNGLRDSPHFFPAPRICGCLFGRFAGLRLLVFAAFALCVFGTGFANGCAAFG